jgi:hypothetical protein
VGRLLGRVHERLGQLVRPDPDLPLRDAKHPGQGQPDGPDGPARGPGVHPEQPAEDDLGDVHPVVHQDQQEAVVGPELRLPSGPGLPLTRPPGLGLGLSGRQDGLEVVTEFVELRDGQPGKLAKRGRLRAEAFVQIHAAA